jgi:hypothetical protein
VLFRDDRFIGVLDSAIDAELIVRLLNNDLIERGSMCVCDTYDPCEGQCCGAGQCSCSLPLLS